MRITAPSTGEGSSPRRTRGAAAGAGWRLRLLAAALTLGLAPTAHAQGIAADTDTPERAHYKLSSEVVNAVVAVARVPHPLTARAVADVEESGVIVDPNGRLRVAVTLAAPLEPENQEAVDELGVEVEKTSKDGLVLRAWVPAENVEGLASLPDVVKVGPASSWR